MSSFYEWLHLSSGVKVPHEFHRKYGELMWVVGIYELLCVRKRAPKE